VLRKLDRFVAPLSWIVAAAFALMLLVGPQVVAEDKAESTAAAAGSSPYAQPDGGGGASDGATVFSDHCGSCHTLSAAGTSGQVGPNLDDSSLDAAAIEATVRDGRGAMPAFGDSLSDADIEAVAAYVADSRE
jgi:mono/diheme cytochrome c family protein